MDGRDRVIRRRKSLTERLGLKGIGCCGSTWGIMSSTTFNVVNDENNDVDVMSHHIHTPSETPTACLAVGGGSSGMNLAAALAAERHFRDNNEVDNISGLRPNSDSGSGPLRPHEGHFRDTEVDNISGLRPSPDSSSGPWRPDEGHFRDNEVDNISSLRPVLDSSSGLLRPDEGVPRTPRRMSLMRLLEETEVYEGELLKEEEGGGVGVGVGSDSVCCVCMVRRKGAAFIPCGHTFCRVCSRELWVNRGCCPLCNRSILEILDIY